MPVTKISLPDLKHKLGQRPQLILLPLFLLVVIVFAVFTLIDSAQPYQASLSPAQIEPIGQAQHVVAFSPDANTWSVGSTHDLDVVFDQMPANVPTTVGFTIEYDPSVLEILDVKAGDLWTKSTFLEKNIDQGTVRVTIAQSLDGKISEVSSPSIITINLRVRGNAIGDSSIISFGTDATLGSVDLDHLEAIVGVPTRIILQH